MKQEIELFNEKIFLSERTAFDVAKWEKAFGINNFNNNSLVILLEDSLKNNIKSLQFSLWLLFFEVNLPKPNKLFTWFKYKKMFSASYLRKNLEINIIADLAMKVLTIEGYIAPDIKSEA